MVNQREGFWETVTKESGKILFYGIKLTKEQAVSILYYKIEIYKSDGKTMFKVLDKDGKETDEYMIYILFKM